MKKELVEMVWAWRKDVWTLPRCRSFHPGLGENVLVCTQPEQVSLHGFAHIENHRRVTFCGSCSLFEKRKKDFSHCLLHDLIT